jgi:hypothetical protein
MCNIQFLTNGNSKKPCKNQCKNCKNKSTNKEPVKDNIR